ncbi:MAG: hypothetical protein LBP74_00225 [Treponema sp.]|nr:hypothetical protein [Treponema sp.]
MLNGRELLIKAVENWPVKVLSVALAIILFVFHRMSVLEERFFSVPLRVETAGSLIPASPYPRMVRVSLRGDANSIYPILEDDIEAYLDLTRYNDPGTYRTVVQIRKTGTALGVDPLEIRVDPLEVTLDLDQRISKLVPVTPSFRGYVEAGYELVSYTLTPTQVVVDGPLNVMGALSELFTDFVDLDGRMEDFSAQVRILNRDPLLVIRGDGFTTFQGFVKELIVIRNLDEFPIGLSGLAEEFTAAAEFERGSIRFEGTQKNLDLYGSSVSLIVDCSAITEEGTYTLPVTAVLPPPLTLIRVEPGEVTIHVGRAGTDEPS